MSVSRLTTSSIQNGFPKYTNIWDNTTAVGSYEAISSITLDATRQTVNFNNIPQTYSHLQLRYMIRSSGASNSSYENMFFNYDASTSNYYAYHELLANGTSATSYYSSTVSGGVGGFQLDQAPGNNATGNIYGVGVIDILDYTNTNKNKIFKNFTGYDTNGGGAVVVASGLWMSTSAVTSITFINGNGTGSTNGYMQYSTFSLYGVK